MSLSLLFGAVRSLAPDLELLQASPSRDVPVTADLLAVDITMPGGFWRQHRSDDPLRLIATLLDAAERRRTDPATKDVRRKATLLAHAYVTDGYADLPRHILQRLADLQTASPAEYEIGAFLLGKLQVASHELGPVAGWPLVRRAEGEHSAETQRMAHVEAMLERERSSMAVAGAYHAWRATGRPTPNEFHRGAIAPRWSPTLDVRLADATRALRGQAYRAIAAQTFLDAFPYTPPRDDSSAEADRAATESHRTGEQLIRLVRALGAEQSGRAPTRSTTAAARRVAAAAPRRIPALSRFAGFLRGVGRGLRGSADAAPSLPVTPVGGGLSLEVNAVEGLGALVDTGAEGLEWITRWRRGAALTDPGRWARTIAPVLEQAETLDREPTLRQIPLADVELQRDLVEWMVVAQGVERHSQHMVSSMESLLRDVVRPRSLAAVLAQTKADHQVVEVAHALLGALAQCRESGAPEAEIETILERLLPGGLANPDAENVLFGAILALAYDRGLPYASAERELRSRSPRLPGIAFTGGATSPVSPEGLLWLAATDTVRVGVERELRRMGRLQRLAYLLDRSMGRRDKPRVGATAHEAPTISQSSTVRAAAVLEAAVSAINDESFASPLDRRAVPMWLGPPSASHDVRTSAGEIVYTSPLTGGWLSALVGLYGKRVSGVVVGPGHDLLSFRRLQHDALEADLLQMAGIQYDSESWNDHTLPRWVVECSQAGWTGGQRPVRPKPATRPEGSMRPWQR